jgi:hypothetical protein
VSAIFVICIRVPHDDPCFAHCWIFFELIGGVECSPAGPAVSLISDVPNARVRVETGHGVSVALNRNGVACSVPATGREPVWIFEDASCFAATALATERDREVDTGCGRELSGQSV